MISRLRLACLLLLAVPLIGRAEAAEPGHGHAAPATEPEHPITTAEHAAAEPTHEAEPAAESIHEAEPTPAAHGAATAHDDGIVNQPDLAKLNLEQIKSYMRLGETQAAAGEPKGAVIAYFKVLERHPPVDIEIQALIGLSHAYQTLNERTRAVAVLERLIKDHAGSPYTAKALLDAGRLHRAMGADRLALSRFYAVLQATLRIPDDTWVERYRQLARTAQYEIAETHLRAGRYDQAERYFTRFSLLELAPSDRARGAFKVIEARSAAGRHEAVILAVEEFIDSYANDPHVPAALHFATTAMRELGRADEALHYTLRLLQATREEQASDPAAWAYWQRRTGNELANTFFQRGEFASARQIYDTLASLDEDPAWRLPANYQAALCRERLGLTEEAITMYRDIVERITPDQSTGLQEVGEMASWRIAHLEDLERERADIGLMINSLPPEVQTQTASNP